MSNWIATSDHGDSGHPGSGYNKRWAGVSKAKNEQYQLDVRSVWGSNQGYLEEHGRVERKYRADNLDELMRIGIAEVRADSEFEGEEQSQLVAAIRDAIFEAQDAEAEPETKPEEAARS